MRGVNFITSWKCKILLIHMKIYLDRGDKSNLHFLIGILRVHYMFSLKYTQIGWLVYKQIYRVLGDRRR